MTRNNNNLKINRNKLSTEQAWNLLFDRYEISKKIQSDGLFYITAEQIKEYREPRLMAKWDSSGQLPAPFKNKGINILPNSRRSYVMSDFLLYEEFPEERYNIKNLSSVQLPELETIDIDNINSEANAINILQLSGILEDFLELDVEDKLYSTFNGRMSSGSFNFKVDTNRKIQREVFVDRAQIEIDGGFESRDYVVILEAKNVLHDDFLIRQLYYPFRLWESRVQKPVKLIFSVYTNKIFRLMEYCFEDKNNYSSIKLIKTQSYSLEDISITTDELIEVYHSIREENLIDDNMYNSKERDSIPFVQADDFNRIINLMENMYSSPMTGQEIMDLMVFTNRQKDYYYNAGKYLGIFEKIKTEDSKNLYKLTSLGESIYQSGYKKRQLKLVEQILSHKIFYDLFGETISSGELPSKERVVELELGYNVCTEKTAGRRASTVISWLRWILTLEKIQVTETTK